ncbi:MAG: protein kinase [Acidobacteria bacterium]|nr:protein kinase [Acidobacteriota bacterium]MCL5288291.1 protein kinase [Acidobacteriota bacterium]
MNRIGRYDILEELGRGAMGAVYKARDSQIGRTVAIKVILTANLSKDDLEHFKQRFYREAQTAGKMSHPGIVTLHDIAESENGQPYLVMEFVAGTTLEKLLSSSGTAERYGLKLGSEPLPVGLSLDMGIQLAEALDYAHRQGVIHRDIKPANILVAREETGRNEAGVASYRLRVKIADFGIAKMAGANLTQTGTAMGTPAFMSPEQVSMGPVDSRSDLFSLGGVLYWMFTGEKPFAGETLTQISFKVVFGSPLPVAQLNPKLPAALDVVLSRCLAKNPDDRYATGHELAADLELIKAGKPLKTTLAPVSDITLMQSNPLPVVAAALPAAQRPPQTPVPQFTDNTVRVGSHTEQPTAQAAPAAPSPKRDTVPLAPTSTPAKKSNKLLLGVAAAIVVLVIGGYFLIPRKAAEPVAQPPTPAVEQPAPAQTPAQAQINVPPPPPEPTKSAAPETAEAPPAKTTTPAKPAPAKSAEPLPVTKKAAVGAKSSLQIDCRHNFEEATLIVTVDGKQLLRETLVNKKSLTVVRPVGAGEHKVMVQVISEKAKFDQQQEISGEFAADATRALVIEFGKGTGLGLRKPKLSLKWGK